MELAIASKTYDSQIVYLHDGIIPKGTTEYKIWLDDKNHNDPNIDWTIGAEYLSDKEWLGLGDATRPGGPCPDGADKDGNITYADGFYFYYTFKPLEQDTHFRAYVKAAKGTVSSASGYVKWQ